jgi:WD40 repeat protein
MHGSSDHRCPRTRTRSARSRTHLTVALLASAGLDRLLILWDVSDPAHPRQIGDPLPAHINKITAIAFAPDGATLVTASADHTFILWDLTDPTRPRQLGDPVTASATELSDAAFSPHGDTLAIGSADGSTRMWDLDGLAAVRADPLGRACAITGKSLDIDEWAKFVPNLPYVDSCAPNAE